MIGRKGWYIPVSQLRTSTLDVQFPIILYERIIISNENEDAEDEAEIMETV